MHKLLNTQKEINMIAAKQGKISLTKGYPRGKIYKALEEDQPLEPIRVILLHNTEDFGPRGQIVVVENPKEARRDLLLPGLAVYATDENLEKYKDIIIPEDELVYSSQYIKKVTHMNTEDLILRFYCRASSHGPYSCRTLYCLSKWVDIFLYYRPSSCSSNF